MGTSKQKIMTFFVLLNESSLGTNVWLSKYYAESGRSKNLEQRLEKTLLLEFVLFNYLITYKKKYSLINNTVYQNQKGNQLRKNVYRIMLITNGINHRWRISYITFFNHGIPLISN